MSTMLVLRETMKDIAQAIRDKMYNNANNRKFYPNEMANLINNLYDWNTEFAYGIEPDNAVGNQFWCGEYVESMKDAFRNQYYRDAPVVCGNNVLDYSYAYYGCTRLTNSFNVGPNVTNMSHTFEYCANVWNVPKIANNTKDVSYAYANCYGFIFQNGTNAEFLYDYTLPKCYTNPICTENVNNFQGTYSNCWRLEGYPACNENVTDFSKTYYNCFSLIGNPITGNNVDNMSGTYYGCFNLTGEPVSGKNVINMSNCYANCYNITGNFNCGENVRDLTNAFRNCYNLNGYVTIGDDVRNMANSFRGCLNILNTDCESEVTDLSWAFADCHNAEGVGVLGNKVQNADCAYLNCFKLTSAKTFSKRLKGGVPYRNCISLRDVIIDSEVRPEWDETYQEYKNFPFLVFEDCISITKAIPFYPGYYSENMYKGSYFLKGNMYVGAMSTHSYTDTEPKAIISRFNKYGKSNIWVNYDDENYNNLINKYNVNVSLINNRPTTNVYNYTVDHMTEYTENENNTDSVFSNLYDNVIGNQNNNSNNDDNSGGFIGNLINNLFDNVIGNNNVNNTNETDTNDTTNLTNNQNGNIHYLEGNEQGHYIECSEYEAFAYNFNLAFNVYGYSCPEENSIENLNIYSSSMGYVCKKLFVHENGIDKYVEPDSISVPYLSSKATTSNFIVEVAPSPYNEYNKDEGVTDCSIYFPDYNLRYLYSANYRYDQFY